MQSGISGTENIPYASVCSIEELTPHLGTHMEVEGDFVRWWGVSSISFIGSHQLFALATFYLVSPMTILVSKVQLHL